MPKLPLRLLVPGLLATLAAGGVAAASAGVSDVAGDVSGVLSALEITDRTPDAADEHIDAISKPDTPAGGGQSNGPDDNANDNAEEGAENANDGIGNSQASEQGLDHANDNAFDGSSNAEDGAANRSDVADEHAANRASGPDSLPDAAQESAPPDLPEAAAGHADPPGRP
jgi:hypothetical protein